MTIRSVRFLLGAVLAACCLGAAARPKSSGGRRARIAVASGPDD
jgi:hypothetical protein